MAESASDAVIRRHQRAARDAKSVGNDAGTPDLPPDTSAELSDMMSNVLSTLNGKDKRDRDEAISLANHLLAENATLAQQQRESSIKLKTLDELQMQLKLSREENLRLTRTIAHHAEMATLPGETQLAKESEEASRSDLQIETQGLEIERLSQANAEQKALAEARARELESMNFQLGVILKQADEKSAMLSNVENQLETAKQRISVLEGSHARALEFLRGNAPGEIEVLRLQVQPHELSSSSRIQTEVIPTRVHAASTTTQTQASPQSAAVSTIQPPVQLSVEHHPMGDTVDPSGDTSTLLVASDLPIAIRCLQDVQADGTMVLGPLDMIPAGMDVALQPMIKAGEAKSHPLGLAGLLRHSEKKCARNSIVRTATSWTGDAMLETCKGCFDKQLVCVRWSEADNVFLVLPLPTVTRPSDSSPDMLSWYQTGVRNGFKKTGLWG